MISTTYTSELLTQGIFTWTFSSSEYMNPSRAPLSYCGSQIFPFISRIGSGHIQRIDGSIGWTTSTIGNCYERPDLRMNRWCLLADVTTSVFSLRLSSKAFFVNHKCDTPNMSTHVAFQTHKTCATSLHCEKLRFNGSSCVFDNASDHGEYSSEYSLPLHSLSRVHCLSK